MNILQEHGQINFANLLICKENMFIWHRKYILGLTELEATSVDKQYFIVDFLEYINSLY